MVLNTLGVLGKGSSKQVHVGRSVDNQGLNILGSSWETRLLFGVLQKKLYDKRPEMFIAFLDYYANDALQLTPKGKGFTAYDKNFHLAFIGSLGDWPYHAKSGNLNRSWNNVEKQAEPQKHPKGICHECRGGQREYPWEDFNILAAWVQTIHCSAEAWTSDGPFLKIINYRDNRCLAYRWDFWHSWHLGVGKGFLASTYVRSLMFMEGDSAQAKLDSLNEHLRNYVKLEVSEEALSFVKLTRDKLSWSASTDYPAGKWQKATDTVILHRHVISMLTDPPWDAVLQDEILEQALDCAKAMDYAITEMYSHGLWIPAADAKRISMAGLTFLQGHARLVASCIRLKVNLYLQQPKLHVVMHIFLRMLRESRAHPYALNPMSMTVQMGEDFIGRVSRSSRRVAQKLVTKRTGDAYLIQAQVGWQKRFVFGEA